MRVPDREGTASPGLLTMHERGNTQAGDIEGGTVVTVDIVVAGCTPQPAAPLYRRLTALTGAR
ncbi:MAG TPA: hypothetical protein VGP82_03745 [Ktedonobacterales bacterium]|nr:hypothetical protein [Ktedonobacterales bacterium]